MQKVVLVAILLLAVLIAGCLGQNDRSTETLGIRIEGEGDWAVALPLPLSEDGPSAKDWMSRLGSGDGAVDLVETEHGVMLQVVGEGTTHLSAQIVTPCCTPEHYLGSRWSAGGNGTGVRVGAWNGSVWMEVTYNASSNWCGRQDRFFGAVDATSGQMVVVWTLLPRESETVCQ